MGAETTRGKAAIQEIYNHILPALAQHIHQNLTPVIPLFENFVLERILDTWTKGPDAYPDTEISVENGNVQQLGLRLRLEGFNKAGVEAFDLSKDLFFKLGHNSYTIGPDQNNSWLEKEYLQRWEQSEYETIAEKWSDGLIDDLTKRLEV